VVTYAANASLGAGALLTEFHSVDVTTQNPTEPERTQRTRVEARDL